MIKPGDLPDRPGVYIFRNAAGDVIYVGKARSLRARVRSYFQSPSRLAPRTARLSQEIADLDFIATDGEVEALVLELNLIKRHRPRYNVMFADDKHFPYIRVSGDEFPRLSIVRSVKADGARYFGPFTDAGAVAQTLRLARKLFGYRTCSNRRFHQRARPCLYSHIKRCPGPCSGQVSKEEYGRVIDELCLFLEGRQGAVLKRLRREMNVAAEALEFERAAVLRDRVRALDTIYARQTVVLNRPIDQDLMAIVPVTDPDGSPTDTACVQVLLVRDGRLVGEEHLYLSGVADLPQPEVMDAGLKQYYREAATVPPTILVNVLPQDRDLICQWLGDRIGRKVSIRVPRRGPNRALIELAVGNAELHAKEYGPAAEESADRAELALAALAEELGLPGPPARIEGYDTSAHGEDQPVAAMVVFSRGIPDRSGYRRFSLGRVDAGDDLARLKQAVRRRAARLKSGDDRFGPRPDLVLVDGGSTQRRVVADELAAAGHEDVPVIALAKEREVLHVGDDELVLARSSPALQLLQRVRDEAHRFAITYHRRRRSARSFTSVLDAIPGVGPARRRELRQKYRTLRDIARAPVAELTRIPGIGRRLAETIKEHLADYS